MNRHEKKVLAVQNQLKKTNGEAICLADAKTASNITNQRSYKNHTKRINLSHFDEICSIDTKKMQAVIEPRVSMKTLFSTLAKAHCMPKVVPEFSGITVGGAINGCGGECSSHKTGLFHNTASCHELLLADGEKITASKESSEDLFQAVHGSYGSLALLTATTLDLLLLKPYVRLSYFRFSDPFEALHYMQSVFDEDFVEGIVFSKTHAVIIIGSYVSSKANCHRRLSKCSDKWFYHHARSKKTLDVETMDLEEYLFRYDRGAFWMGAYLLRPKVLFDFLLEGALGWKASQLPWLSGNEIQNYATLKDPSFFSRFISCPFQKSQFLYRLLHLGEKWVEERFLIQDFTLPATRAKKLMEHLFKASPVFPIWLCPLKQSAKNELFSPAALDEPYCINLGVYGICNSDKPMAEILTDLEKVTFECGGRKWLYTNSCYDSDFFWKIYDKKAYVAVRKKYGSETRFLSIEEKTINK